MKKIFSLCAALVAAMSMSATVTNMTCADAAEAALALGEGATGTDTVAVTGYVTNTNGTISRGQQTFYMDDAKGTTQTLQSYWGNLPQECVDNNQPLQVGDKVVLTGLLMHYVNSAGTSHVAEIKNGAITILERAVVNIDTIVASVCEVYEEGMSLNSGEYSDDVFDVTGLVASVTNTNTNYNQATFYFACEDNDKALQGYNVNFTGDLPAVGDSVRVIGKIMNYNGTQVEFNGGQAVVTAKSAYVPEEFNFTVAQAVEAGMAMENGFTSPDNFHVTGYVDSIAYAFSESNKNMSFYMCDDMAGEHTYQFEAYRVSTETAIEVGTKVKVSGHLQHYYKAATETAAEVHTIEISNGTVEILSAPQAIVNNAVATKATKAIVANELVIIKNGVRYNVLGARL